MRKMGVIISIVVAIAAVVAVLFFFSQPAEAPMADVADTNVIVPVNAAPAPADDPVVFTRDIFDVRQVNNITPLGELNGGYTESQSFAGVMINMKRDVNGDADMMNVYAPTDMTLTQYAHYAFDGEDPEWALYFQVTPGLTMTLHHIREAGERIASVITDEPVADSRTKDVPSPIMFSAGDLIARTDGTSQAHNWNIYMYDTATQNQFARQERYTGNYLGDEMSTATCVFDYYPEDVRQPYETLFGYSAPGQSASCGTVARDVVGSVAGLWYFSSDPSEGIVQEQDGVYATPFAAYTTSDDTVILHEIDGKRFDIFSDNSTYVQPSAITTEHCYQLTSVSDRSSLGYAYFRIVDDNTMQLAYSASASCPNSFPEDQAQTYYR